MSKSSRAGRLYNTLHFSSWAISLYGRIGSEQLRSIVRSLMLKLENGPANSLSIREVFQRYHKVEVGLYTPVPCTMKPAVYHPGTTFGRYVWVDSTVRTFTRNHPSNIVSTHGFFYYPGLGKVKKEFVPRLNLRIGHGAWIGHNAIILAPTEVVGVGAVLKPGAVVYSNVPDYAVVEGFPARVVGYRYDKQTIQRLLESRWWEKNPKELERESEYFEKLTKSPDKSDS